jgi:hypothetical protein
MGTGKMEPKLWQKVVKIVVFTVLLLANLWVWLEVAQGCGKLELDSADCNPHLLSFLISPSLAR